MGYENLSTGCRLSDSRRNVDGNSFESVWRNHTFARVQPHSQLKAKGRDRFLQLAGAPNCPCRTVKCRMEAVARALYLNAPKAGK